MRIINGKNADELRRRFIDAFVNTGSEYYKSAIREERLCSDGMCYLGHLWECFMAPGRVTEKHVLDTLSGFDRLCAMWDINSQDRIPVPDHRKYPKRAVLELTKEELSAVLPTLPEDVYFFDGSFSWAFALTHEYNDKGGRYCLECGA